MADLVRLALLRNLEGAEQRGDALLAADIRRRLSLPVSPVTVEASIDRAPLLAQEVVERALESYRHRQPVTAVPPIAFASPAAAQLAAEYALGPEAFSGREPSGKHGYTIADVESALDDATASVTE